MGILYPWLYPALSLLYLAVIAGCIAVVLSENRNPIRALAWTIALIALPGVGLVFYLFFGRSLKGLHLISRHNKRRLMNNKRPHAAPLDDPCLNDTDRQLVKLAENLCRCPLSLNNHIDIFTDGRSKFEALRRDLREARSSIYLQYYIFSDDALGREIADLLMEKARQGVRVKVIYDHVGSFSASRHFFRRMREAGVEAHPFFKVTFPQLANRINWRNHRKIVIIDNATGYIGGMNIASRYVEGLPDGSAWRDTHFRVWGEIVESLLYSFAIDWNFLNPHPGFPPRNLPENPIHNHLGMQFISSGPVDQTGNISMCFLKAIASARKRIYIQTPYFLPTDTLMRALEVAAMAQVDVRVMMPRRPDSRMLRYASFSYVTQCLRMGIKVYLYEAGMLHAKAMIVDDNLVTAGSTNFDFRSFENNFEANLLIYDAGVNRRMRDIFFDDMKACRKLTLNDWRRRPLPQRLMESVVRLFSPIL
ncbi:MAG: cardiolipin synthase [Muribaculaceae bacterium]|nr:cardiolipin synthase [Muribaculaceae bacterium]